MDIINSIYHFATHIKMHELLYLTISYLLYAMRARAVTSNLCHAKRRDREQERALHVIPTRYKTNKRCTYEIESNSLLVTHYCLYADKAKIKLSHAHTP